MTTGIELYKQIQAMKAATEQYKQGPGMKPDMNDRMDGCKAFWLFISVATLTGAVFIVLSSGVGNG